MTKDCENLHLMMNQLEIFTYPIDYEKIPLNGIYVVFEKGELGHNVNRIVRVGTHTGKNNLRSRLKEHFETENKDRSIFRKNIGRALLSKREDPFLSGWDIDLTTRTSKTKNLTLVDTEKLKETEQLVSNVIRNSFSFVVIEVANKEQRLKFESRLISTISSCSDCIPSKEWLGCFSPKDKIRKSGLWLEQHLFKKPMDQEDIRIISQILNKPDRS